MDGGAGGAAAARERLRGAAAWLASALLGASAAQAHGPDPEQSFLENFFAPAYFMPVFPLAGQQSGDLTARYDQAYIQTRDAVELLILGEFPRARFFSITLYDDHGAIVDALHDAEIEPLRGDRQNPFRPGGPAGAQDILYAVRVRLGAGWVEKAAPGCGFDAGADVTSNVLDGRFRHTAGTRYSPAMSGFTVTSADGAVTVSHDDGVANRGVSIMVRRYLEEDDGERGALDLTRPVIFVRNAVTGCAYDLWELAGVPPPHADAWLPQSLWYDFDSAMQPAQVAAHRRRTDELPYLAPYGTDPGNKVAWFAGGEYARWANPHTGYLTATLPSAGRPAALNAAGRVMRLRFRLPQLPCRARVCPAGGGEARYWGLTLSGPTTTLATISDLDLEPDGAGYVTLLVTFGTPLPAHAHAGNGYSVVALPAGDAYLLTLRLLLPAAGFECSPGNVPAKHHEHHAGGGYMGEYAPFVDFPLALALPDTAAPLVGSGSCAPPD